jgi:transposase
MKEVEQKTKTIDLSAMGRRELEEYALQRSALADALEAKVKSYEELLRKAASYRFGPSSERYVSEGQMNFFNEVEAGCDPDAPEPERSEVVPPPKRRKKKGHKKDVVKSLPHEIIEYTLSDDERVCPKCGGELSGMKTVVRTAIEMTPAKYTVVEHRSKVYTCRNCDKEGIEGTIITAPSPNGMFRNSLASPSFVADVMYKKYTLAQPLYRQEKELARAGVPIGRNTLANWVIKGYLSYLSPLYEHMRRLLLTVDVLHADETPVEVLKEPGKAASSNSYMWMYRTGACFERQIILFSHTPGRGAEYPKAFLDGYRGYIHTDGYSAYRTLLKETDAKPPPDIAFVGCFGHARRKYADIVKGLKKNETIGGTATEKALGYIGALFKLEEEAKGFTPEKRHTYRQKHAVPIVNEYFDWCRAILPECVNDSLRKAVSYSLNQENDLRNYLLDGRLDISNNLGENSIRPFCVGRRNWLFCDTPAGADASAAVYGIIETARANGLDAFGYLKYIFTIFKDRDIGSLDMDEFMPWVPAIQDICRKLPAEKKDEGVIS